MMAKRQKAKTGDGTRKALARRLLDLRVRNAKIYDEEKSLKAALIAHAAKEGEGFREFFDKEGTITVSPPKDRECRGNLPEVDVSVFNDLSESRRDKLVVDGVIKIVENWSRQQYGRVEIKTF
jgi:hypothetical protein